MTNVGDMTNEDQLVEGAEETEHSRSPLLPDRHPTGDLFVCDIFDAVPKGDIASMAHPIFSLSTKPDTRIRRYESGDSYVEIIPSANGLATVYDRDILIYCISQVIAGINADRKIEQTLRIRAHDLLKATNRTTSGEGYEGLKAALERLAGTRISTNITTGDTEIFENFGLIERSKIVRQTREGRMELLEIKLSDWVFNAIQAKEVLTLNRAYFRLRKPLERRMYELGRKHCGAQNQWSIALEKLQEKCGSNSTPREFNRLVKNIVAQDTKHGHFPDYVLTMKGDTVTFTNRGNVKAKQAAKSSDQVPFTLDEKTLAAARRAAPGYDPYALYADWLGWWRDGGSVPLQNPVGAFVGFCRNRFERVPNP
jgi:plasmid replication initiation protein